MKGSFLRGLSFGLTSAVITTLGLLIGLYVSTNSRLAVISGIIIIAIADALSDSLGMHLSVESEGKSNKEIWESTFSTLFSKFIFAITFIVPFLFLAMNIAVLLDLVWGFVLITAISVYLAKRENVSSLKVVFEHLFLAIITILLAQLVGYLIRIIFV